MIAQDWWQADYPLNNVAEIIHKLKCKYEQNKKNCKICGIKYNDSECCLDYIKDDLIEQNVYVVTRIHEKFAGRLKKQFVYTYSFSNHDINMLFYIVRRWLSVWIYRCL